LGHGDGFGEGFQRALTLDDGVMFTQLMLEAYAHRCAVTGERFADTGHLPHPELDVFLFQPRDAGGAYTPGNAVVVENGVKRLLMAGLILVEADYRLVLSAPGQAEPGIAPRLHLPADAAFWPDPEHLAYHRSFFRPH